MALEEWPALTLAANFQAYDGFHDELMSDQMQLPMCTTSSHTVARQTRRIMTDFTGRSACGLPVPQLPSSWVLDRCQVIRGWTAAHRVGEGGEGRGQ